MRSKFAIWSDQGILSPKPGRTGLAWLRGTIFVGSVCGIAAAGVYTQIGPDSGTVRTERATGYGTEERLAEQLRAQASAGRSTAVDEYVRSGATTGAASPSPPSAAIAAAPQSSARIAGRALPSEPTPSAATPESSTKTERRITSESTRAAPEPAKPARRTDDQNRQATSTAAEDSPDRTPQRRRTSSAADSASRGNSGKDYPRSAATKTAPQEPAQARSELSDAATAKTAEAPTDPDGKTAQAPGRVDEKSRGARRYARSSRSRGDNYAGLDPRDRRDTVSEPQGWWAQEGAVVEPQDRRSYPEFSPRDRRGRSAYAEFEPRDRRNRDAEYEMGRLRRTSRSWPFGWFGTPF
jgi:hypothetical protein